MISSAFVWLVLDGMISLNIVSESFALMQGSISVAAVAGTGALYDNFVSEFGPYVKSHPQAQEEWFLACDAYEYVH
jgi:hypothetical protein